MLILETCTWIHSRLRYRARHLTLLTPGSATEGGILPYVWQASRGSEAQTRVGQSPRSPVERDERRSGAGQQPRNTRH